MVKHQRATSIITTTPIKRIGTHLRGKVETSEENGTCPHQGKAASTRRQRPFVVIAHRLTEALYVRSTMAKSAIATGYSGS